MAHEITDLSLEEVSAVDVPANKDSRVVLLKAGERMDEKERLLKRLTELLGKAEKPKAKESDKEDEKEEEEDDDKMPDFMKKQLEELTKQVATLQKANEDLRKELTGQVEKSAAVQDFRKGLSEPLLKAFDAMDKDGQEEFIKSFQRNGAKEDPVAKALEQVTKEHAATARELAVLKQESELAKVREDLKDLQGVAKVDDLAAAYLKLSKSDAEAAQEVLNQIKVLAKQAKDGGLFKVLGRDGQGAGDVNAEIEKRATAYQTANPSVTKEAAIAKVLELEPDLYARSLEEGV